MTEAMPGSQLLSRVFDALVERNSASATSVTGVQLSTRDWHTLHAAVSRSCVHHNGSSSNVLTIAGARVSPNSGLVDGSILFTSKSEVVSDE